MARNWQRCAFAVHGPAARYEALSQERLHGLKLRSLALDSPSEEIHCWMTSQVGAGNESFKTSDPEAALACHRAGGSLYFRAPPEASELLVTALSQQLGMSFGALHSDGAPRSEVETFVSRAGHVTHWHFDFMENFTLQLQGKKRWKLKHSGVRVPVRGCTPQWGRSSEAVRNAAEQQAKCHAQHAEGDFDPSPDEAFWQDAHEVVMEPGSFMYFPAGMWHQVECEEDSISINVSIMGQTWADLIAEAVRQRLLAHPESRAPICMGSITHGREQARCLLRLARRELAALTAPDLLPRALALPRIEHLTLPTASETANGVRLATKYRRNPLAVLFRLHSHRAGDDDEDDEEDLSSEEEQSNVEEEQTFEEEEQSGEEDLSECAQSDEAGGDEDTMHDEANNDARSPSIRARGLKRKKTRDARASAAADAHASRLRTRCGDNERLVAASCLFPDGSKRCAEGHVPFVVHVSFGSEDLGSLLRVQLDTPAPLVPMLEWLGSAPTNFSAGDAWRAINEANGGSEVNGRVDFPLVAAVLSILEDNGFCRRRRKQSVRQNAA